MTNLPEGLTKADMAHINGDDGGYSDWLHDNLEDLEDEFYTEEGYAGMDSKKLWALYPKAEEITDKLVDLAYAEHGASIFDSKRWESWVVSRWTAHCGVED